MTTRAQLKCQHVFKVCKWVIDSWVTVSKCVFFLLGSMHWSKLRKQYWSVSSGPWQGVTVSEAGPLCRQENVQYLILPTSRKCSTLVIGALWHHNQIRLVIPTKDLTKRSQILCIRSVLYLKSLHLSVKNVVQRQESFCTSHTELRIKVGWVRLGVGRSRCLIQMKKTIQRNHCEGISRETESESAARWSEF